MTTQAQQKPAVTYSVHGIGPRTQTATNVHRSTARIVGALFLTAIAASLVGSGLVESAIAVPDYLVSVSGNDALVAAGLLLELVNAVAVVGIGVLMYPILKSHLENMARGYLSLRLIEAVFCGASVIGPLALLILSQSDVQASALDAEAIGAVGALAMAGRAGIVNLLIPIFFCLGAFLLYISVYRASLLPRFIPLWGFAAAVLVLSFSLASLFVEFDMWMALFFGLPIIANEVFLGIWLIVKGFNTPGYASVTA